MTQYLTGILLIGLTLHSFSNQCPVISPRNKITPANTDTAINLNCTPRDTTTLSGNFIKYKKLGDEYVINWGNKNFSRQTSESYSCSLDAQGQVSEWMPYLYFETKTHLGLKKLLNTAGAYDPLPMEYAVIILPLNDNDSVIEIENYIQTTGDYVISTDLNATIIVYNMVSKKNQEIDLFPPPGMAGQFEAKIKKLKIKHGKIYIAWDAYDSDTDKESIKRDKWKLII